MTYQITRNGQTYGPYTLDDLKRYLASGNILPTDLATSGDMPDPLPVSQIVAATDAASPFQSYNESADATVPSAQASTSQASPYQTAPYQTAAYPAGPHPTAGALSASRFPDPPNLHWGLLLLLTIVTNGIFQIVWDFVQCSWLKKVQPESNALTQYIVAYGLLLGGAIIAVIAGVIIATTGQSGHAPISGVLVVLLGGAGYFGGFVMVIVARFSERASLLRHFNGPEPVGLRLSGVMTFVFGSLYFQYHLTRINALKQAARMGYPAPF